MSKICQNCNQSNPSEAAFCLNCAKPLSQEQFWGGQQPNKQWNQPNFGGQQPRNFAQPVNTNGASQRATVALILGLAGLFCCGPITSLPAIIVGWMEISAINQGQSSPNGKGLATTGIIIGIGSIILQVGGFLLWMLLVAASNSSDTYNY